MAAGHVIQTEGRIRRAARGLETHVVTFWAFKDFCKAGRSLPISVIPLAVFWPIHNCIFMSISYPAHPANTSNTSLWRNGCKFLVTELNITSTTTRRVAGVQHTNTVAMLATVTAEYVAGFISANADKCSNWDEAEKLTVHTSVHSIMTIRGARWRTG